MINKEKYSIAYLSMEIALENDIKTYAGGLGVLAGDILKSAASKSFPLIGLTLLNRYGYFKQKISSSGNQLELIDHDFNFSLLKKLETEVEFLIGNEKVRIGVWQYLIKGKDKFEIPIYFLDTNIRGNNNKFKQLSTRLYGGDLEFRLQQELVLGRAGLKMLEALGYNNIKKYHLNEGHGAFAGIELLARSKKIGNAEKIKEVKKQCIFTTHTPIKTVYDDFPLELIMKNQSDFPLNLPGLIINKKINTLDLGFYFAGYINGVSKRHQELLNTIYKDRKIEAVTNGVNSVYWSALEFKKLFDSYSPGWRGNACLLKKAKLIPLEDIWLAHQKAKRKLLEYIIEKTAISWSLDIFTFCFARRFTDYKQPLLLFTDIERLISILEAGGGAQIIFAGKAHLRDLSGQDAIKKIYQIKKKYQKLKIIFLENYNLELAQLLVAGVDLWVNVPIPPLEASGTSGMKAAHNGVPQLSTLDGWWLEGYKKNKTGWAMSSADDLYETLKNEILPMYYQAPEKWRIIMQNSISINASYFNSDRVVAEYIRKAYK